ncbi:MAG: 4Fe-4S ferredoxin, partial [Desulfobacterales bacterium]|nr:4Fe-4S ferredoxin [Desulfobacterales bacterium]
MARALSEKGETFLDKTGKESQASESALEKAEELAEAAAEEIASEVPTESLRTKAVKEVFEAPFWEETAFACINCGTCTYLCPTCWCFDIQDEV